MAMQATYKKMKDGTWGVVVKGKASKYDMIDVLTKAGKKKIEMVDFVLWTGTDKFSGETVSICKIAQTKKRSSCGCDAECCARRCTCEDHCVCRGGNVHDC